MIYSACDLFCGRFILRMIYVFFSEDDFSDDDFSADDFSADELCCGCVLSADVVYLLSFFCG